MMRYPLYVVACLLVVSTCPHCSPTGASSQSVITVGDRSITLGDLEKIVDMTSLENGVPENAVWSSIDSLVERIVDEYLILEYGRERGISVPEIELERSIQDIVKDYPDNTFEETLLERCIDYNEWKKRFCEQLLIRKIIKQQADSLPPISHLAVRDYYEENRDEFRHPPRVKLLHIIVKTRRDAEALRARLQGGEDMAEILKEQSAGSALEGDSDKEWHTGDMLPQAVSDRAFSMEPGRVSGIIKTDYGFHIIKVVRRETAGTKGLLEVLPEIEKRLLSEATERHYRAWLQELRSRYTIKVNHSVLEKRKAQYESS
jgi:foldase protein PrsA